MASSADIKTLIAGVSRRSFLATSAAGAALGALPRLLVAQAVPTQPGLPSAHPLAPPDINWKLECRYTTGGAPYRPAFPAMFLDPLFVQIAVGPNDLGSSGSPLVGPRIPPDAPARGVSAGAAGPQTNVQGSPAAAMAAGTLPPLPDRGNAPIDVSTTVPADLPLVPSNAVRVGLPTLTTLSQSVVLLNDRTNWEKSSRDVTEAAYNANQELIGVVVFHNAVADNQDWPFWYQQITGGQVVLADRPDAKKTTVTRNAAFSVSPVGNHPIVMDLPPFRVTGEDGYKGMWQAPNITPLVEANGPASDKIVAWLGPNPARARVVNIAFGSAPETLRNPWFRRFVRNAILWAGHRLD